MRLPLLQPFCLCPTGAAAGLSEKWTREKCRQDGRFCMLPGWCFSGLFGWNRIWFFLLCIGESGWALSCFCFIIHHWWPENLLGGKLPPTRWKVVDGIMDGSFLHAFLVRAVLGFTSPLSKCSLRKFVRYWLRLLAGNSKGLWVCFQKTQSNPNYFQKISLRQNWWSSVLLHDTDSNCSLIREQGACLLWPTGPGPVTGCHWIWRWSNWR